MAIQTQLRRGTTAENDAFTGAIGELVYDTQKKQLRMQDGTTLGGIKVPLIGDFESTGITDDATATVLTLTALNNAEFNGNVKLGDGDHLYLGTNNDLDFYHDGTNARIINDTGEFFIKNEVDSGLIRLTTWSSALAEITGILVGGAIPFVRLYYDNIQVMDTVSEGIRLKDSKHLYLGTGKDLDIYHDSTASRIDNNTGVLAIKSLVTSGLIYLQTADSGDTNKNCIQMGGAIPNVSLFYDGVESMKTNINGIELGTFSSVGATAGMQVRTIGRIQTSVNVTGATFHAQYYNPNGLVGSISTTGTATSFTTSSDKRLKTSHGLLQNAAIIVNEIEIHKYHFNSDESLILHGVMAQDCIDVYPNAISHDKENDTWGADYSKLVPVMLANIQELNRQVQTLQGVH